MSLAPQVAIVMSSDQSLNSPSMVMVALFLLCVGLASFRGLFAIGLPLLTLASATLAWFRWTLNATLTPMILDAAL